MNCLLALAPVVVATVAAYPQASPDETAVRSIIHDEIAAWNSGDAVAFSRHFAADGTFTNIRGQFFTGREAFTEKHDFIFKGVYRGTTMKQDVVSLKFVRPDVAIVETLTAVIGIQKPSPGMSMDEKGRLRSRLLQIMVKDGGEWKIVTFHNTDVRPDVPVPDPQ
ncbi:MAG: SgcJ/EcaC family oxidoreductase [Terriglobales bacterium]